MHTTLILSFELFVLVAALFLYVYISKQEMHKAYRYFAGTIAVIMIIFFLHDLVSNIVHHRGSHGHGYEQCGGGYHGGGSYCGSGGHHGGGSYHGSGGHHASGGGYGCGYGCGAACTYHGKFGHHGKYKNIEKRVTIKNGERHEETIIDGVPQDKDEGDEEGAEDE